MKNSQPTGHRYKTHNVSQKWSSVHSNGIQVFLFKKKMVYKSHVPPTCHHDQTMAQHNRPIWTKATYRLQIKGTQPDSVHSKVPDLKPNCFATSGSETRPPATTSIQIPAALFAAWFSWIARDLSTHTRPCSAGAAPHHTMFWSRVTPR